MKEFGGDFECLGENTEKYITFSVPIKKKIENKDIEITYKIKFIDSFRFMATSLSKLVDNLTEDIHGDKCVNCKSDLTYMEVIDEALIFKCFNCKNYEKEINKELIEILNNLDDYHDLYVQSDTLLLADVFENFRKACIKNVRIRSSTLHIITRISMASMFEKNRSGIRVINRL